MKLVKEAVAFLWDEKLRAITAVIQIVLFIITLSLASGALAATEMYVKQVEKGLLTDKLFVTGGSDALGTDSDALSERIPEDVALHYGKMGSLLYGDDNNLNCLCYESDVLRKTVPDLYKGSLPEKVNECIVSYDLYKKFGLKVGDILDADGGNGSIYRLSVCGILKKDAKLLSGTVSGSSLTLKIVYPKAENTLIFYSLPQNTAGEKAAFRACRSGIAVAENNRSAADVQKKLNKNGYTAFTFEQMTAQEKKENYSVTVEFAMISVILVFVGAAGITVNNFLVLKVNKRKFGIYYACGMSRGDCFKIIALRNFVLLALSAVISFFGVALIGFSGMGKDINVSNLYVLLYTAVAALILVFSSLPVYYELKRKKTIELFKE